MRARDIDTDTVLRFLARHQGRWATWGEGYSMPTVQEAMPPGTSRGDQLAKMRELHRLGFVSGCTCGCRGDWEITDVGLAKIDAPRTEGYSGYGHREGTITTGVSGAIRALDDESEADMIQQQAEEVADHLTGDPDADADPQLTLENAWAAYGEPGDRAAFEALIREAVARLLTPSRNA